VNGVLMLAALQSCALALLLSFVPGAIARRCAALFLICAGALSWVQAPPGWGPILLIASAISVLVTVLPIHLQDRVSDLLALVLSACAGSLVGLTIAVGADAEPLATLPIILLFIVGRGLVTRGYSLVPKVISGWLVAIALLSAALPLVATPGYVPDHID
jgi:hypothetical protein